MSFHDLKENLHSLGHNIKEKGHIHLSHLWHRRRGFDRNSDKLPLIVSQTCDWLDHNGLRVEGIFRVSATSSEVALWKKKFDKGKPNKAVVFPKDISPYVVAGVMKQFFIEPEESILTTELYDAFMEGAAFEDEKARVACLSAVIAKLPVGNKVVFKRLCCLLHSIASPANSAVNKMTSRNLSIVWSPSLLRKENRSTAQVMTDAQKGIILVETFIQQYSQLFEDPPVSHVQTEETAAFFKTLRLCTVNLMKSQLKEMEQKNEIEEIAAEFHVPQEEVNEDLVQKYYSNKMKKATQNHAPILRSRASLVWDTFPAIKMDQETNHNAATVPQTIADPASKEGTAASDLSKELGDEELDPAVKELFSEEELLNVSSLDKYITKMRKLGTAPRSKSFTDAFKILDEMGQKQLRETIEAEKLKSK